MSKLKKVMEKGNTTLSIEEDPDNWWTPRPLYNQWCKEHCIYPELDVFADQFNHVCPIWFDKIDNALEREWLVNGDLPRPVWSNPPGKLIQQAVEKAEEQWRKHNMDIMNLIPVNTITNKGFEEIWDLFLGDGSVEIWPQFGLRPLFLDGRTTPEKPKEPNWGSRNGYIILIFRKK